MKQWSNTLDVDDLRIPLSIEALVNYAPIEDYREVNFSIPGKGPHRAVFWLLPDRNSDNPYAVMPKTEWSVPVRWDDNTMLFVPSMDDHAILAAMYYIFRNKLEASAFENLGDTSRTNS